MGEVTESTIGNRAVVEPLNVTPSSNKLTAHRHCPGKEAVESSFPELRYFDVADSNGNVWKNAWDTMVFECPAQVSVAQWTACMIRLRAQNAKVLLVDGRAFLCIWWGSA